MLYREQEFQQKFNTLLGKGVTSIKEFRNNISYCAIGAVEYYYQHFNVDKANAVLSALYTVDRYYYRLASAFFRHYLRGCRFITIQDKSLYFTGKDKKLSREQHEAIRNDWRGIVEYRENGQFISNSVFLEFRKSAAGKTADNNRDKIEKSIITAISKAVEFLTIDEVLNLITASLSTNYNYDAVISERQKPRQTIVRLANGGLDIAEEE